jgi:choline dehydrogenase-like flavoprotein
MLERGDWVERGEHNRDWSIQWNDRPEYSLETPYPMEGDGPPELGAFHCVGGPSVFYGGVALRFREEDFDGAPEVSGDVRWPFSYADLEPYYDEAERLLGVSGSPAEDPTSPPRRSPMPPSSMELSATSRGLAEAALRLGLSPFRLPLALNVHGEHGRARCTACGVCDGYACSLGAKNDLATAVLPRLIADGLLLRPNTVAVSLETEGDRVVAVRCVDRLTGEPLRFGAREFVVAAGALATPHLLLSSGLARLNPAGDQIGRNLMRHCNGVVVGASLPPMGEADEFRKQIGLHDFYFGDPGGSEPAGKLGAIQQVRATQIAVSMARLPRSLKRAIYPIVERMVGFIVIAEDQPRYENRVRLDPSRTDRFGRPVARIEHRYTPRDLLARRVLGDRAAEVLCEAGSAFTLRVAVPTFSHGVGTVRMGEDPERFPLAPDGRFRGVANLRVTDGSIFPTAGAVNPSLSISANALRIASAMVRSEGDSVSDEIVLPYPRGRGSSLPVVERREA